jgi:hypothetical protein
MGKQVAEVGLKRVRVSPEVEFYVGQGETCGRGLVHVLPYYVSRQGLSDSMHTRNDVGESFDKNVILLKDSPAARREVHYTKNINFLRFFNFLQLL